MTAKETGHGTALNSYSDAGFMSKYPPVSTMYVFVSSNDNLNKDGILLSHQNPS